MRAWLLIMRLNIHLANSKHRGPGGRMIREGKIEKWWELEHFNILSQNLGKKAAKFSDRNILFHNFSALLNIFILSFKNDLSLFHNIIFL